jgi:peptide/nickel transport system ATP-binding protein
VAGLSFEIRRAETYALVGESGSGKTTVARALSGLVPYVSGQLDLSVGHDLRSPVTRRPKELLRSLQFIFQNPDASLNPRQRVRRIIGRPLEVFFGASGKDLRRQVDQLLEDVHLDIGFSGRFPDELSGGERQRVALARALAASPSLLLCDEILSALDVSVQASILRLLIDLQNRRRIAYLFISHDLATVRSLAHYVGVLYRGTLCEKGTADEVFSPPFHPYTHLLLASVPEADPDHVPPPLRKDVGLSAESPRTACPFAARCPWSLGGVCENEEPPWRSSSETHALYCHLSLGQLGNLPALSQATVRGPAR